MASDQIDVGSGSRGKDKPLRMGVSMWAKVAINIVALQGDISHVYIY